MTGEDVLLRAGRQPACCSVLEREEHVLLSAFEMGLGPVIEEQQIGLETAVELAASSQGDAVFLTTKEAAALARLSPRSLERMRGEGRGPRYCKIGGGAHGKRGRVVYPRAGVIAWLMQSVR